MIPDAYDLKRRVARHWKRFWYGELLRGVITAPVYHFADQERFDSDEVQAAGQRIAGMPLRLPHRRVVFEVKDRGPKYRAHVALACETETGVQAVRLTRMGDRDQWSDVLAHAAFNGSGWAAVLGNPRIGSESERDGYAQCLTGIVWRALAILAKAGTASEQTISRVHWPKLASAGVRGWTWHQVEIVPERLVRASEPAGGSHASPRWHVRRGHWRQLADGRRVFVQACEVGDPARGGVVKDYLVGATAA